VCVTGGYDGFTWMMEPLELSRGVAHCKSPFLVHQLSVFFTLARYRVVKIACSCSEVVLRTIKNYKLHYHLSWFRPSDFLLKKENNVTIG
jgi:hypothetical protein